MTTMNRVNMANRMNDLMVFLLSFVIKIGIVILTTLIKKQKNSSFAG